VSAARAELPSLLTRVEEGEEVAITRHGRPVAILVRPDALRVRRAAEVLREADLLHRLVEFAGNPPQGVAPGLTTTAAEELVAHIRAARDAD
jgi:antitoxin (DNA-binding transcriptional repressor) of toxin-antitoxin stability system